MEPWFGISFAPGSGLVYFESWIGLLQVSTMVTSGWLIKDLGSVVMKDVGSAMVLVGPYHPGSPVTRILPINTISGASEKGSSFCFPSSSSLRLLCHYCLKTPDCNCN